MLNLKFLIYSVIFSFLLLGMLRPVSARSLAEKVSKASNEYESCFKRLPAKVRWSLDKKSSRHKKKWSRLTQKKVEGCLQKRRVKEDHEAVIAFKNDLKQLYKNDYSVDQYLIDNEAEEISDHLIHTTRKLQTKYQMGKSPLWHNFLIKVGSKDGGYCYQWAEDLLKLMPQISYKYFERVWGVHNKGQYTENNAIIIKKRGGPLSNGIVYDPWRGHGGPFWKRVSEDNQQWKQLFTEDEILAKSYVLEPE